MTSKLQKLSRYTVLLSIFFVLFFAVAPHANAAPLIDGDTITSCTDELTAVGTYYLTTTIGSGADCLTISQGVIIDGTGGGVINGNINGNGLNLGDPGFDFTLQNITVSGTVSANGADDDGTGAIAGGNGGSITISNSTTTSVTVNGGYGSYGNPGAGGTVTVTSSITGAITAGGGPSGGYGITGSGGSIIISGTNINVSGVTLDTSGGADGFGGLLANGTISISYTNTFTTNTSTFFYNTSNLTINNSSYGAWNAVYNPTETLITSCAEIVAPAVLYTLSADIVGDCTIAVSGAILDGGNNGSGGHYSVSGSVIGNGDMSHNAGYNFTLQNITVGNVSSVGTNEDSMNIINASAGGSIALVNATATSVTSSGGNGTDVQSGANAGNINITNSSITTSITANGGNGNMGSGANGGAIIISGTSIDLSSRTVSATGGVSSFGLAGTNGTLTLNYTTLNHTGLTISALSNLTVNGPGNLPGVYGVFAGGDIPAFFPLSPGTVPDCGYSLTAGTYTLGSDLISSGTCLLILADGAILDGGNNGSGGHHSITGDVNGDGVNLGDKGHNFTLRNITVTGTVTSNSAMSVVWLTAGDGGDITIATSTIGSIESNGGLGDPAMGNAGNGGTISFTNSTATASIHSNGGGTDNGICGLGGSINIINSTTTSIVASAGTTNSSFGTTCAGGSISVTNSSFTSIISKGSDSFFYSAGPGGSVLVSGTNLDISNTTISSVGGSSVLASNGSNGTLSLTYTGLTTDTSTYFNDISELTINGDLYGPWNGVFNPTVYYYNNATADGDWYSVGNWWTNIGHSISAVSPPIVTGSTQVFIDGNIDLLSSGVAVADTLVFNGTSINSINISVSHGATFNASSQNGATGTISGNATFMEDSSNNVGSTTGTVTRLYTTNATTTRNFVTEGGRNDWTITAQGVVVDLTGATYNTTDVFKALLGGSFITNPSINSGASVVPVVTVTSPTAGTITKWLPVIGWYTATVCEYSYDNFSTASSVTCGNNGSDIPKPPVGSNTLYLRATDAVGNITETSGVTFTYVNNVATYTTCGTDLLDEATRPYYYLTGDVTDDCTVTASTILYGNATLATSTNNGFTITGNVVATSTTGGLSITLKGVNLTGSVFASGANNASGTGYAGGTVTVATSTTGNIYAKGGDSTFNGGNGGVGGTINITNSLEYASSTLVNANGGDALTCGAGGNGGEVNLTGSTFTGDVTSAGGVAGNNPDAQHCNTASPGHSSGSTIHPVVIIGTYVAPSSGNDSGNSNNQTPAASTPSSGGTRAFIPGTLNPLNLPVNMLKPVTLKPLPSFGDGQGSFNFKLPLNSFIRADLQESILATLKKSPALEKFINSLGIKYAKDLINLQLNPIALPATTTIPGLFTIKSEGKMLPTALSGDKNNYILETVKVSPGQNIEISYIPLTKEKVTAKFNGKTFTFINNSATITATTTPGRYILTSTSAAFPLAIDVIAPPPPPTKPPGFWSRVGSWFGRLFHR